MVVVVVSLVVASTFASVGYHSASTVRGDRPCASSRQINPKGANDTVGCSTVFLLLLLFVVVLVVSRFAVAAAVVLVRAGSVFGAGVEPTKTK